MLHYGGVLQLMKEVPDEQTPPDCVYAGFNKIKAEKKMHNFPFGGHTSNSEYWLADLRAGLL